VKKPKTAKDRRCAEPDFDVIKPRRIDDASLNYTFCPGKATWYGEIAEVFEQCRVALETGILPSKGTLEDQDEIFVEVFPYFVQRWRDRQYQRVWVDIRTYIAALIEGLLGKK
jgi:hypothetical protein